MRDILFPFQEDALVKLHTRIRNAHNVWALDIVIVLEKTQSQVVKSRYELSNKIQRTNNRISQGRAYVRRNKSGVQSINLNNTEMGKAIKREGGLKTEKAHAETQENRSR